MVTIITATGSPILISAAQDVRIENRSLVCVDAGGQRLLSFDPLDVMAYAVEAPGVECEWVMGGLGLLASRAERPKTGLPRRLTGLLRPTYR
jgi:hypothetical protein